MNFLEQDLQGVYLISPEPFEDERGVFRRHFCKKEFASKNLFSDIKQTNISENKKKHTLRGFHFQFSPHGENKIISCVNGSIFDIVVDLREASATYLNWQSFELDKESKLSLYVPKGCANAYLTMEDNTWILYYHSEFYNPGGEGGIRYNDPFFSFKWPFKPKIISKRDCNFPDWSQK